MFTVLEDLDFADDIVFLSHRYEHIQEKSTKLNNTAKTIGLKINQNYDKYIIQSASRKPNIG
jgi:uncharacterized surface anchored protein